MDERAALARAVELARGPLGDVEPNPPVGAVLLQGGAVVGAGAHEGWGGPHAEIHALAAAGARARGATAVVTLEPCATCGKTGPCTEALLAAGVRRVVAGCVDPNPAHAGAGLERLRRAGLEVELVDDPGCRTLLTRFERDLLRRRPHVLAKWAMSREGAIAPADRRRVQLSSPAASAVVSRWRAHADAIVVGRGTVEHDDPELTVRDRPAVRPQHRVVLDPQLRLSPAARLVETALDVPTWVVAEDSADAERADALESRGARVLRVPGGAAWLADAFALLWVLGLRRVLVEGGAFTLERCLAAGLVDQVAIFLTPVELGSGALPALASRQLGGLSAEEVARALALEEVRVERCGPDTLVRGFL